MSDTYDTYVTEQQRCRAAAILDARAALESRGRSTGPLTSGGTNAPLVEELLTIAEWIVTGQLDERATAWWINRPEEQEQPRPPTTQPYPDDVMPCSPQETR